MCIKKSYYLLLTTVLLCFTFINSSFAQCNCLPANTYYVFSGTTYLTSSSIPLTGNNYCIEVGSNATLRIDDFWSADNVCITVSPNNAKIVIESGQLANLTNSSVHSFSHLLIEPFTVEAGATFQVGHTLVEDVRVGFRVKGSIHFDDVEVTSGSMAFGVAVVGPSSENVYIDNSSFHHLQFGITLLGITNNLTVANSHFYNIDEHGLAATGVGGTVSVYGTQFNDLTKGMHFGSSMASHILTGNTTSDVGTGIYTHTLGYMYLSGNTFSFNQKGADLRYIEELNANGNTFSSTQANSTSIGRIGLDVTNSNGNIVENVFEGMDVGAFFREYNGFDNAFTSNQFVGTQTHGLYLADGARIGPQCYQHNKWVGSYSQDAAYSPDFSVKYNSKFTVNKYATGEMPPSHSPSGWFVHSPFPCEEDQQPGPGLVAGNSDNWVFASESTKQVSVSPNPAINLAEVSFPSFDQRSQLELRDLTGRIIQKASIEAGLSTVRLDLSNIHPGIYTLTIQSDNFKQTKKIIVAR